jgi:hypothetical protein
VLVVAPLNTFVVFFKDPALGFQLVVAESCHIVGDHLVFLREDERLAALFLLSVVKRWSTIADFPYLSAGLD